MKQIVLMLIISFLLPKENVIAQNKNELLIQYEALDSVIEANVENHTDQAITACGKQIKLAEQLGNDSLKFEAKFNQAQALNHLGMFDQTLEILYNLLKTAESNKEFQRTSRILYCIGSSYFQMGDHKKSYQYYLRSKDMAIKHKQFVDTLGINIELALALVGIGRPEEGIKMLKSNIEAAKKAGDVQHICLGLDNLSNSYFEIKNYVNALKYQMELLKYPEFFNNSLHSKTGINQHLAEINIALHRWDEAQKYLTPALAYATELGSNDWLFDCYKNQSAIYEAKGNYKEALLYHQKYLAAKDTVYKDNYDERMSAMANLYELEHKENQINQLGLEQKNAALQLERLYIVLGALVMISAMMAMYFMYRKKKNEKDLQQKISFELLNAQEEERQRISKELHDSVGQNLLFLKNKLQSEYNVDDRQFLIKSVEGALDEIRAITKNLYPNQLEKYGLTAAVEALAEEIRNSTGIFVSSDIEGIDEILTKNVKINFYRIIQEFANNTIKHANATAIRITAYQKDQTIDLVVQDNGKGFDTKNQHAIANKSSGLLNMEERIKMLKGSFHIESSPGSGTKSTFTIPV